MRSFERLISCLKRFPGVGPKQAERLAIHVLRAPRSEAEALAEALLRAKEKMKSCRTCLNYTEEAECRICGDPGRDASLLCVVEQPADVAALERSQGFRGMYHVLHGRLSPLRGVGPENIKIDELVKRLGNESKISEVILATDPDTDGEATALYLADTLKGLPVRVTRIAQGIPMGGHLDYMDEQTLSTAMKTRRDFSGGES
jgi:recombination protein RecR